MIGFFQNLTACAVVGSVCSGIFFLLRHSTRRIFGPGNQYRLWILLLVLWVLPLRFALPVPVEENTVPSGFSEIQAADAGNAIVPQEGTAIDIQPADAPEYPNPANNFPILPILQGIWGVGILFFGALLCIPYLRFRRLLNKTAFFLGSAAEKLPVYHTFAVDSPMVVGLFRPALYLPEGEYAPEDFACILRHELTHVKRGDIPLKWFAAAVRCLHWWNPLVHLAVRQFAEECEISCDFRSAVGMDEEQRKVYMKLLLDLAERKCRRGKLLTTGFSDSKAFLKRRLMMIQNGKKQKWLTTVLASLLLAGLSAGLIYAGGVIRDSVLPEETDTKAELPAVNSPLETEGDLDAAYAEDLEDLQETLEALQEEYQEMLQPEEETEISDAIPVIVKPGWTVNLLFGWFNNYGQEYFHKGVDFLGEEGESIPSASAGEITCREYHPSYGNMIIVKSGEYEILYAHLSQFTPGLAVGDSVEIGTVLGEIGQTGAVTGPHLHFEVRLDGQTIDPASVWVE